jgi:hypothetical protein
MAHYAFLDENNIVTQVIVGVDETETIEGLDPETWYTNYKGQTCKRTSYNGNIRFNYAGIGMFYDENLDAFITDKPYPSWVLDDKCQWVAPIAKPEDGLFYDWDEANGQWKQFIAIVSADAD